MRLANRGNIKRKAILPHTLHPTSAHFIYLRPPNNPNTPLLHRTTALPHQGTLLEAASTIRHHSNPLQATSFGIHRTYLPDMFQQVTTGPIAKCPITIKQPNIPAHPPQTYPHTHILARSHHTTHITADIAPSFKASFGILRFRQLSVYSAMPQHSFTIYHSILWRASLYCSIAPLLHCPISLLPYYTITLFLYFSITPPNHCTITLLLH